MSMNKCWHDTSRYLSTSDQWFTSMILGINEFLLPILQCLILYDMLPQRMQIRKKEINEKKREVTLSEGGTGLM